jgi:hypothetical protein
MDRDKKDFVTYLQIADPGIIEYHDNIDFIVGDDELVIVDEADAIMYEDPEKFREFVSKCACICFTATPDD